MNAPDPAEIDRQLSENVRARTLKAAQRRQRTRKVRAEFDAARAAGLAARKRQKLQRIAAERDNMSATERPDPPVLPADHLDHARWCTQQHVREVVRGGRVTVVCMTCDASDDSRDDGS